MAKKSGATRRNQTKKKERNKAYKPRSVGMPSLVGRELFMKEEMIKERSMITAFSFGHATYVHWERLVWMANILNIAGQVKSDELTKQSALFMNEVATDILARQKRTGKFGVTGPQRQHLINLANKYEEFWQRQTSVFYNKCLDELYSYYDSLKEKAS